MEWLKDEGGENGERNFWQPSYNMHSILHSPRVYILQGWQFESTFVCCMEVYPLFLTRPHQLEQSSLLGRGADVEKPKRDATTNVGELQQIPNNARKKGIGNEQQTLVPKIDGRCCMMKKVCKLFLLSFPLILYKMDVVWTCFAL